MCVYNGKKMETIDLTSYHSGYDKYCEPVENIEEFDNYDVVYDEFMIRGGSEIMKREIIDLNQNDLTIYDIKHLNNYIWKGEKLIPVEVMDSE